MLWLGAQGPRLGIRIYTYFRLYLQNGWMPHNPITKEKHLSVLCGMCDIPTSSPLAVWRKEGPWLIWLIWYSWEIPASSQHCWCFCWNSFFPASPLSIHGPQSTMKQLFHDAQGACWRERLKHKASPRIQVHGRPHPSSAQTVITHRQWDIMGPGFNDLISEC